MSTPIPDARVPDVFSPARLGRRRRIDKKAREQDLLHQARWRPTRGLTLPSPPASRLRSARWPRATCSP
ncbi:hypothetical protein FRACA_370044 [Frankia canadensis]|uniref:Uncharacterized protein n=1 Tax=Frankia canadensis TaxID=1836972 RepID=A0A2I2KVS4_9ACTN|nr:hypothetical protein FRACA_370044 [Frankia canadensis]SOU57057.1 hypothetical protein FRACA_370044 [Frankia canadensis]